jgi:uncharacterized membrane protein YfcA
MPWYVALFWIVSALLVIAAWVRGGWPERVITTTLLVGVIVTRLARSPLAIRYHHVEWRIMVIDLITFAIFVWVAVRSNRRWPLLAAALLVPSLLAHLGRLINPAFHANGYSIAGLTTYLLLPVIAAGIWRTRVPPATASARGRGSARGS